MSEISKYLKLARTAREEDKTEDAKKYYDMVRTDDPENGEAKFFYAYYALYEGKNGEIPKRFSNLCDVLKSSIKMVKEYDYSDEEKTAILKAIYDKFVPTPWSLVHYMDSKNKQKVGNSYITVFEPSVMNSMRKDGMKSLKELGDYTASLFESSPEGMNLAVKTWKEYVTLAQKWWGMAPKGDAEAYTAKIQKIEPSYEMPKKGACISFSEKR